MLDSIARILTSRSAFVLYSLTLCLVSTVPANATVITSTIGEYDGPTQGPQPSTLIGTFTYTLPAGVITSATVSGFFGTTYSPDTDIETLYVAGIQVASCSSVASPCYLAQNQTPWSYTFTPAQLSALNGGSAAYTVIETGTGYVESGITTLSITITPEPATVAMLCGGLAVLPILLRRRRA